MACVETLLRLRANPALANDAGETPIRIAAEMGRPSFYAPLLQHGADPNLRDPTHHCTPLEEAQVGDGPGHREVEAILRSLIQDPPQS